MPLIKTTANLKLEKPEAAHNAWEQAYWRLATIVDLWLTQLAKGHHVVSGGNLALNGTAVDLDATVVAFVGQAATHSLLAQTPIPLLATGNTYVVYVDNAGAPQVSTLDASGLWSGALPADFVLLGVVYEVEGAWTIHNLPLKTGRSLALGVAGLDGVGDVMQEPASKGLANGIASLDGTAAVVEPAAFDAGISGAAKTLDFAQGRRQLVTLDAHTRISLQGGVDGQSYELLVRQAASGRFTMGFKGAVEWGRGGRVPQVAQRGLKTVRLRRQTGALPARNSFGDWVGNALTPPTGPGEKIAFSPAGDYIAVAHNITPAISVYEWRNGSFGAKVADPVALPSGNGLGVAFSPAGDYIAVAHSASPFISVYPWSAGFGAKVANPVTLPTQVGVGVAFSPAGDYIAVAHATSPFISVYPWSAGFGAKVTDPVTLPAGNGIDVVFSPAGDYIAVAHAASPFISVYPWSAGFGAKVTDPVTLPAGNGEHVVFSPAGDYIAVAHATSPFISVYPWSAGFGAKVTDPVTLPTGNSRGVAFSPAGDYIAVAHNTLPFISVYPWSAGFGAKVADPVMLPVVNGVRVIFSPAGDYIVVTCAGAPFHRAYAAMRGQVDWIGNY